MTLTLGLGPLSGSPSEHVNYSVDGPAHRLFFESFPRRVRAVLGGTTVADTDAGMLLHETGILPRLYVPEGDVASELLEPSDRSSHCPFKGDATYWSVSAGGRRVADAVWGYPDPLPEAAWLSGYVSVYPELMDEWYDEDERVLGHLRDPYHRVDVRASSRHVRVLAGEELIADTNHPMVLSETGLPNRFYIPRDEVRADLLEPSDSTSVCPYKGSAGFWSVKARGRLIEDAGWSYADPLDSAAKVQSHICFLHDELVIEVDGRRAD